MLIWGWGSKSIGSVPTDIQCSHCGYPSLTLTAFQRFFDFFYIPTLPLKKEYILFCSNCGTQFLAENFNIETDNIHKIKTPWWGFSGLAIISILAVLVMYFANSEHQKNEEYLKAPLVNDIIVFKEKEHLNYVFIKITAVNNDNVTVLPSKYEYSSLSQANKVARSPLDGDFIDKEFELSLSELKELDVQSVKRLHE